MAERVLVQLPLRLPSASNLREHWSQRHRRVKQQRADVLWSLRCQAGLCHGQPQRPLCITLTRIAPRQLDGDNLQGAFKACRDAIAQWLHVPDNHPLITWRYAQARRGVGEYGITIHIRCEGGE